MDAWCWSCFRATYRPVRQYADNHVSSDIKLRRADVKDIDAMTSLVLDSSWDDPVWPYRFPYAQQYPDDSLKYTRLRYGVYMDNVKSGFHEIILAEAPSPEDPSVTQVVGMSVWALPGSHLPKAGSHRVVKKTNDYLERRDGDPARIAAFKREAAGAKRQWFDAVYGENQLYLLILVTHPRFRRRGIGATLVRWGLEKAAAEHLTVALLASPMGFPLYSKLGFRSVGTIHVQVDGEEEFREMPGMVWTPQPRSK